MPANRVCPVCGEQKERLSRHWSYCEWPSIGADLQETLRGILLGAGSLQGNGDAKHLIVQTQHRELADWLLEQLDWLAHSCKRREGRSDHAPTYVVRSHAHETLGHWRHRWYDGDGCKRIRTDVTLTPHVGRLWWALAGGLEWGEYDSQQKGVFSAAQPGQQYRIAAILAEAGFDPTVHDDRVVLKPTALDAWLEWIGPSVPGVEHKWATNRIEYQTLRRSPDDQQEYKAQLCITALQTAATDISERLTPARFDEQVEIVDSTTVMDTLGGGNWLDALSVAGVQNKQKQQIGPSAPAEPEYTQDDVTEALEEWVTETTELSYESYHNFSKGREDVPSVSWFYNHYQGFRAAVDELLDVELPKVPGTEYWTRERSAQAVAMWIQDRDDSEPVSSGAYREFESGLTEYPALSRLYELFDGWDAVVMAAAEHSPDLDPEGITSHRKRTVTACPDCDSPVIMERKTKTPQYRCSDCGSEFETPLKRNPTY